MFDWDKMRPARSAEELWEEYEKKNRKKKREEIILGVQLKNEKDR